MSGEQQVLVYSRSMKKLIPYAIFLLGCFLYIYEYMLRIVPSTITTELMSHFGVQAGGLGLMAAMFFYGYMPMQIPAGFILDRLGVRRLLTLAILFCALATLAFPFSHNIYLAGVARLVTGICASFGFIGALVLAARWLPKSQYAFWGGFVQLLGALGAIIGLGPVAALTHHYGWQQTLEGIAWVGFAFVIITVIFIRSHPKDHPLSGPSSKHHLKQDFRELFRNKQTWFVGLIGFFSWAPISVFASLWGVPFLISLYHNTAVQAGNEISLIWIGVGLGSPLFGWWSNKINSRKIPLITAAICATVAAFGVLYGGAMPKIWMDCLLFLFGLGASSQMLAFALIFDISSPRILGTANGIINMFVMTGGLLIQPLVGFVLNATWDHHSFFHGVPFYSAHDFHIALCLVPLVSLLNIVVSAFFVKETLKKPRVKPT